MNRSDAVHFASTESGREFERRYDRVLGRWPGPVERVDVGTGFGTTRVNVCGPEDAPPVILLPSGRATSTVWFAVAAELCGDHRVFAVDLPGDVGLGVVTEPLRSRDDLMDWISAVVHGLELETYGVVGHSYGAMVALAHAVRRPDGLDRLVLLDPNSCFAGMSPQYLARAVPLLVRPTGDRQRRLIGWESAGATVDADWLDLVAFGAERFPAHRPVVPRRPWPQDLQELRAEVTVVLAERSRVHDAARIGERARSSMPRATIRVIPGESHYTLPMSSSPELGAALRTAIG
ncbi:alpha/beta fold hydrolase [Rhodococcus sp. W8901]|uniref:alpha/beta fold hydrolase n=1 Tax=Rhodococcus sp. W8901 TaxID=2742603 RepID=UPI001581B2EF|nr:alpha/beta hydrolase [Rhodococcus sp. W8901]QKT11442.1 alpha/beta hydrolase [Rhodococcus sp. W8901]